MKTITLGYIILSLLIFSSCKKNENDNNSGNGTSSSLKKMITIYQGGDKDSAVFSYDSKNRLIKQQTWGNGTIYNGENVLITRNNVGIITSFSNYGTQSEGIQVLRDASNKYTCVNTQDDSTVYKYTDEKITESITYRKDSRNGENDYKNDYSYDQLGNIIKIENYSFNNGNWIQENTFTYTYDNKVNPVQLGNEAIVLERAALLGDREIDLAAYAGPNNATISNSYSKGSYNYVYNSDNLPISLILTHDKGTINQYINKITYFY